VARNGKGRGCDQRHPPSVQRKWYWSHENGLATSRKETHVTSMFALATWKLIPQGRAVGSEHRCRYYNTPAPQAGDKSSQCLHARVHATTPDDPNQTATYAELQHNSPTKGRFGNTVLASCRGQLQSSSAICLQRGSCLFVLGGQLPRRTRKST
jgi:hypothetical protein